MAKPKPKKALPHLYNGPPTTKGEIEQETDDIYKPEERETMLEEDEVTAAEAGFMEGYTQEAPGKKATQRNSLKHDDSISDELAKEDAEED